MPPLRRGKSWPGISIVTPSYNQAEFIEETIRSVLLQGYPDLEYFIIDGGSTDGSVNVIEKYASWLTYWCSEKDRGQAHAINKGLDLTTGRIAAYINSDDFYLPGAFAHLGAVFNEREFDIFVGKRKTGSVFQKGNRRNIVKPFVYPYIFGHPMRYELPQECIFWNRRRTANLRFDESFRFCLDAWWFAQIYSGARVVHSARPVGVFRQHPQSKTSTIPEVAEQESRRIVQALGRWTPRVTADMRRRIHRTFVYRSFLVTCQRLFMTNVDFLFSYSHPPYNDAFPAASEEPGARTERVFDSA